jgi:LppP/LprE lipoprotein
MGAMKPARLEQAPVLALAVSAAALLGGCGSQTKTVSAAGAPAPQSAVTTSSQARTPKSTTKTTPAPSSGTGTSSTATRTAPEPAFTQGETHAEGVQAAAAVLRARGYSPGDTSQYHPDQTLRVLVGTHTGSSDGYGQQAFFFLAGRYIGTDTKLPSATVKVVSQGDTEVTLAYPLYRAGDPLSSPSGGQRTVTFQLDNGHLTPLGSIPPASSASGLSRN